MITVESLKAIGAHEGCGLAFSAVYPDGLDPAAWTLEEQLRVLKHTELRGYLGWAWRNKVVPQWSMSGANLFGADLSGADLSGADLTGADLRRADLRGADLRWVDLTEADLSGADLSDADLRKADLRGANLTEVDLFWTDLNGANLIGADLSNALLGDREPPAGWRVNKEGRLEEQ